jgi:heme exporter protein D
VDLGPNAVFVWSSYGAVAILLCGLMAWLLVDGWRQQHKLAELEARGMRRRSAPAKPSDAGFEKA